MSNYKTHAELEFRAAGWTDDEGKFSCDMQELICKQVMELLDIFDTHGHSGSTAPYAINLFKQLASFEPVVPLTGEDWEWNEVGAGVFQNKRCSHVFKQADRFDGQPYDIDGKIFWEWCSRPLDEDEKGYPGMSEPYKSYFTSGESCVPITFPYTPKREYVFRATDYFPYEYGNA